MAYVIGEKCVSCGTCAPQCPVAAISEGDTPYVSDPVIHDNNFGKKDLYAL